LAIANCGLQCSAEAKSVWSRLARYTAADTAVGKIRPNRLGLPLYIRQMHMIRDNYLTCQDLIVSTTVKILQICKTQYKTQLNTLAAITIHV